MEEQHQFIRDMDPTTRGIFLAFNTAMIALTNEVPGSRDRLIAFLLDFVAKMPDDERASPYGLSLSAMIEMMENTQFPDLPSGKTS